MLYLLPNAEQLIIGRSIKEPHDLLKRSYFKTFFAMATAAKFAE